MTTTTADNTKLDQQGAVSTAPTVEPKEKERIVVKYLHFGKEVRIGSRKIQIKHTPKFTTLPKDAAAKVLRDEVIKKIGSQFREGSRDIIRGLTSEEESYYLPSILGIKETSESWNAKVFEYWANFSIEVPGVEDGIEFEAGFKVSKGMVDGKMQEIVVPISLDGYMKYNFCLANSKVANEDEDNFITYTFQMIDRAKKQDQEEANFKSRKEVDTLYLRLIRSQDSSERTKIDWILQTYGGEYKTGINIHDMNAVQKEMALEKLKNTDPVLFADILNDSQLEMKSIIRRAVSRNEIQVEGTSHFYGNKNLGNLNATIGFFSDKANEREKMVLIEKLKDK